MTATSGLFAALASVALLTAACGGSSADADEGVATLDDNTAAGLTDAAAAETDAPDVEQTADEAALEFSACMRDEGIDFPDLSVDGNGNVEIRGGFQAADPGPQTEEFRTAMDNCGDLLQGAGFGGGGRAAIGENVEIQDAFVLFSDCVRDAGFDVGDLQLGGPGSGAGPGQDPGGDGNGERVPNEAGGDREGGFGNVNDRFAQGLGLDPDDPDVQAAMEECAPIITDAFTSAGVGPGNN